MRRLTTGKKSTQYPPDPNVLNSKLSQQPDEAWGWDDVANLL